MKDIILNHIGSGKPLDHKLFDLLMEKRFTMKDVRELNENITYRTIDHWSEKQYLLTETKEGDWRKFSFSEYIWILFLNELRELDVSFKKVLSSFFIALSDQNDDAHIAELKAMDFEGLTIKVDKLNVLENFCWLLVRIISYKTPITIRFLKDAEPIFLYGNPAFHGMRIKSFLDKYKETVERSNFCSSISISISSLIENFISNKDLTNISNLGILNDEEIEILEHLRNGELKEITIFFAEGRPERIQLVEEIDTVDATKRIKENFLSDYQRCEYITNGGKKVSLVRTTNKRFTK